jgi:hypothetical protein
MADPLGLVVPSRDLRGRILVIGAEWIADGDQEVAGHALRV